MTVLLGRSTGHLHAEGAFAEEHGRQGNGGNVSIPNRKLSVSCAQEVLATDASPMHA